MTKPRIHCAAPPMAFQVRQPILFVVGLNGPGRPAYVWVLAIVLGFVSAIRADELPPGASTRKMLRTTH